MSKSFIKLPFSKLDFVHRSEDGYITNGHWAISLDFIESYPSNLPLLNGPAQQRIQPTGEGRPAYPTFVLIVTVTWS